MRKQAMTTWYCKERASARRIAMSEQFYWILLSFAREAKYFLHVVLQEAMVTSIFFYVISQKAMTVEESRKEKASRLLFPTINATTLSTADKGSIVVVIFLTITVATTAAPPTECRIATVANARLAMGIALTTISLESRSTRLAAKKDGNERTLVRRIARSDDDEG